MVLGMVVGLSPGNFVLDQSPSPKRGQSPLPNFWPISIVAKRLDGSHGMEVGLSHGDFVSDGDPAPPLCFRPMLIIVIVISLEHYTMHSRLVCSSSSSSFGILYILFLEKFNRTQSVPLCTVAPHNADT